MKKSKVVTTLAHDQTQKCTECGQPLGRIIELDVEGGDITAIITSDAFCWEDTCPKYEDRALFPPLMALRKLFLEDADFAGDIDSAIEKLEELKNKFGPE